MRFDDNLAFCILPYERRGSYMVRKNWSMMRTVWGDLYILWGIELD